MELTGPVEAKLVRALETGGIPGCAIACWQTGRTATFTCGRADIGRARPVTPATVFHLFSGTKLYTAAALMRLVERGLMDLDAPVTTYLGDLQLRHPVTVRQLASHSSGLPETLKAFLAVHFQGSPMPSTVEALSRYRTDNGRQPGARVAYRNVNYAILGELITRVSGVPYVDFVADEILRPLGSRAAFDYTDDTRERAATGYLPRFGPMRWLLRLMMPAVAARLEAGRDGALVRLHEYALDTAAIGGLIGVAADFLPLTAEMLTPEDGVLTARSKREMLTLHAQGAAGIASTVGVGLGWKFGRADSTPFWNHEGGGAGFTSETRIYPEQRLGIVILMNATQSRTLSLVAHDLCELIRDCVTVRSTYSWSR